MKYVLFSFLCLSLLFTTSCDNDQTQGSGNVVTDDRTAGAFTQIDVRDAFDVTIRQGNQHQVLVRADDNVLSRINTSTSGGVLTVRLGNGSFRNVTLQVDIITPDLERIEFRDAIDAELIDFTANDPLSIILNDASKLSMTGAASNTDLQISDASKLFGFGFTTERTTIDVNDASRVEIQVNERLSGTIDDASRVSYRGNPELAVNVTDASRLVNAN